MSVAELMADLGARGIELWLEGGRLRFRGPQGAMTPELRDRLGVEKERVIAHLEAAAAQSRVSLPLSYNQQALWFLHRAAPRSPAYNVGVALRVRSAVHVEALRQALQALVDRHATLRTVYLEGAEPAQVVHGRRDVAFELESLAGIDETRLRARVAELHNEPFDLTAGPLFRARLLTVGPTHHVLLLTVHHSAADGWSTWLLLDELRVQYKANVERTPTGLTKPAAEYADYVRWQRGLLESARGRELHDYWMARLSGDLPVLDLPGDFPRPAAQRYMGATHSFTIGTELTQRLRDFAREERATLFVVLLAAFETFLSRYTRQTDVIVGTPALGRNQAEFQGIVGDFVNMVSLRADLSGDPSFRELVAQARASVLEAVAHEDYPFALLVQQRGIRPDPSRSPVVQAMFLLQKPQRSTDLMRLFALEEETAASIDFGGMTVEAFPLRQQEGQFDLTLEIAEGESTLVANLKYNVDLFEPATIARFEAAIATLLTSAVDGPGVAVSRLPIMPAADGASIERWNTSAVPYDATRSVEDLFAAQAARTPDAIAVESSTGSLTYAALDEQAARLASLLRTEGVGPGTLVGICLQRTADLVVAVLGVLKSGGAYVPLDPSFPAQRIAMMVEDARLPLVLTDSESEHVLPDAEARRIRFDRDRLRIDFQLADAAPGGALEQDAAYVLYTSGSTGKPKGVEVPRRALTNFIRSMQDRPGMRAGDKLLAVTTLSFDISGLELYLPLSCGGTIVLATRDQAGDGAALRQLVESSGATIMQATPATWRMLIDAGWQGGKGLKILCGGEPLSPQLAAELLERGASLWNMYGPTETTIWSTIDQVVSGERITIGRPIANTTVRVLDPNGQAVPIGVPGELCIGGDGVARGYLGRPDLTAERFVADPFVTAPGARMYKTGDIARWLPDGRLECLGRLDAQVKIRGFRIELGDIESAVLASPGVREAVAVVEGSGTDARLIACVRMDAGATLDAPAVRQALRERLPDYMIPASIVAVGEWPMTANRKIDRQRLASQLAFAARHADRRAAPLTTPTEQKLGAIWKELLRIDAIGADDNFFALGGHSLLVAQMAVRVRAGFGVDLPLRRIFATDDLRGLALEIDALSVLSGSTAPESPAGAREEIQL